MVMIVFQLKDYVLEVYRTGNFSQAAANLYVSQPSLSASIKRLEERIGAPLFDRSNRPIRLTQCGQAYLRSAQMIITAENNFAAFMEEYSNCQTDALVLGGSNLNVSYILPHIIKKFQTVYPKIQIEIREGNIDEMKQLLLEGKLDFMVDSCDMDEGYFSAYPYMAETLLLSIPGEFSCNQKLNDYGMTREDVLQGKHLQDSQPALPLCALGQIPFVFPTSETDTYRRSWQLCQKAGFTPNVVLSFHQQATVFHNNCAGIGAAFVSDILVKSTNTNADMRYYKLDGSECYRNIKLFKKKEKHITRAMRAFLETAQGNDKSCQ